MVRRRWPDVVIVLGLVGMFASGVWILWGEDLRDWWHPATKDAPGDRPETAPTSGPGVT